MLKSLHTLTTVFSSYYNIFLFCFQHQQTFWKQRLSWMPQFLRSPFIQCSWILSYNSPRTLLLEKYLTFFFKKRSRHLFSVPTQILCVILRKSAISFLKLFSAILLLCDSSLSFFFFPISTYTVLHKYSVFDIMKIKRYILSLC